MYFVRRKYESLWQISDMFTGKRRSIVKLKGVARRKFLVKTAYTPSMGVLRTWPIPETGTERTVRHLDALAPDTMMGNFAKTSDFTYIYALEIQHTNDIKILYMTALETEAALQDKRVSEVTRALRERNLNNDLPFLILSEDLPEGQAYREFPDGHIEIQEIIEDGANLKSKLVRKLTSTETAAFRVKNGLF